VTSPGYPSSYDPHDPRQPPVSPGDELGGKYRIEGVVGVGAMGVVVRAWHIELEQQVAVKFLYPEFARNSDGAERFRREARAAAKIKNQHVARVLDVGTLEDKNIPYIVMEYLEGRDLARRLSEDGPLPVPLAVRYVMQACEAVSEAHERGIVHRDLKPANLFLAEGQHGAAIIKVLDFGISKVSGSGDAQQFSLTDTATLMGSPAYMSPEQLESSRDVDGRADIWSLGVILHELILGEVPFNGESVPQLVRSILAGTRNSLLERDSGLSELENVVARALCQDREERFQSVEALREALEPFADTPRGAGLAASLVTSREGAAQLRSASASAVTDPGPSAPVQELSDAVGGHGVASAWGNTQRGRHRSWQRHAIPLVLVLAGLGSLGYWASTALTPSSELLPAASPSSTVRALESHAASAAPAAAVLPAPAATAPERSSTPEGAPIVRIVTSSPNSGVTTPSTTPGASASASQSSAAAAVAPPATTTSRALPAVPAVASAPAARVPVAKQTREPRPGEARAVGHAGEPAATATAPAAAGKPAEAPEPSDKPKPDTSHRGGLDVPDFGGRE